MTLPEEDFGARLRQQRERRGISLAAVADSTKIKQSLLADLERGDLSRWPAGIFRRAFLREYAEAIGADAADTVGECLRLFPESGAAPTRGHQREAGAAGASYELRLTMASPAGAVEPVRLLAFIVDTLVIAAAAAVAAWMLRDDFWKAAALCAVVYHGAATMAIGRSPASWYLAPRRRRLSIPRRPRKRTATQTVEAARNRSGLIAG